MINLHNRKGNTAFLHVRMEPSREIKPIGIISRRKQDVISFLFNRIYHGVIKTLYYTMGYISRNSDSMFTYPCENLRNDF